VESQLAKLEAAIAVLNAGLVGQLGLDPADTTPIWPADSLRVGGEDVAVDQAGQTALHFRPDLNLLPLLAANADYSRERATGVLAAANPLLGAVKSVNPLAGLFDALKKEPTRAEATIHRQLLGLLATRERQADAEVRAAAATLRGNRISVAAKAAEVRNLEAKVDEYKKRVDAGVEGAAAALALARLDLLKVRGE